MAAASCVSRLRTCSRNIMPKRMVSVTVSVGMRTSCCCTKPSDALCSDAGGPVSDGAPMWSPLLLVDGSAGTPSATGPAAREERVAVGGPVGTAACVASGAAYSAGGVCMRARSEVVRAGVRR